MSKWIYTDGRLGDHAVTMCEEVGNTLKVRRVPFEVADQIEARGGYQCEDKQWGDYPITRQEVQQPDRLPQVGSEFDPIVSIITFFLAMAIGCFVGWVLWNR